MPEFQRFDAAKPIDLDAVWAAFDTDRGLIVDNFITPDLLDRVNLNPPISLGRSVFPSDQELSNICSSVGGAPRSS